MQWTERMAEDALRSTDLIGLGADASALRKALHGSEVATYLRVNDEDDSRSTVLVRSLRGLDALAPARSSLHHLTVSLAELATEREGDAFPALLAALERLRARCPHVTVDGVSASLLQAFAGENGLQPGEVLQRLRDAGVRSVCGRVSASTPEADSWRIYEACARLGMPAVVTLIIGDGEDAAARVAHLHALRKLQEESRCIAGLDLDARHAKAGERREEEITAVDFLKTLAVCRLYLDAVAHVSTGWSAQGPKLLELALHFGADDAGSIPSTQPEAGAASSHRTPAAARREPSHHGGESELRRLIRDGGFAPVARDFLFTHSLLF